MSGTTKVEIVRNGEVRWETTINAETPTVELADTSAIADFAKTTTRTADACIYCGSLVQLSREHILAYALGGTVTIPDGSCERCRKITHAFETAVLRGPMQMVRYIQALPSRTRHEDAPKTIPITVIKGGREVQIHAPSEEAPILLPFPVFEPPTYTEPNGSPELKLCGLVTGSFGADPKAFGKKYEAERVQIKVSRSDGIAFARMLAKTAYAFAYARDELRRLKNKDELVRSMMDEPDTIGRFVGTLPEPYMQYPGVHHRISLPHVIPEHRLLYAVVQLFAGAGAPSYIVVLGTLNDDDPIES